MKRQPIIVSLKAIKQLMNETLGMDSQMNDLPIKTNSGVDPIAAETSPMDPNFSPQNQVELASAVRAKLQEVPDESAHVIYQAVLDAIESVLNRDSSVSMTQVESFLKNSLKNLLKEADEPATVEDDLEDARERFRGKVWPSLRDAVQQKGYAEAYAKAYIKTYKDIIDMLTEKGKKPFTAQQGKVAREYDVNEMFKNDIGDVVTDLFAKLDDAFKNLNAYKETIDSLKKSGYADLDIKKMFLNNPSVKMLEAKVDENLAKMVEVFVNRDTQGTVGESPDEISKKKANFNAEIKVPFNEIIKSINDVRFILESDLKKLKDPFVTNYNDQISELDEEIAEMQKKVADLTSKIDATEVKETGEGEKEFAELMDKKLDLTGEIQDKEAEKKELNDLIKNFNEITNQETTLLQKLFDSFKPAFIKNFNAIVSPTGEQKKKLQSGVSNLKEFIFSRIAPKSVMMGESEQINQLLKDLGGPASFDVYKLWNKNFKNVTGVTVKQALDNELGPDVHETMTKGKNISSSIKNVRLQQAIMRMSGGKKLSPSAAHNIGLGVLAASSIEDEGFVDKAVVDDPEMQKKPYFFKDVGLEMD
jgi:flagellar biosynthesis chaperone FliJ